MVRIFIFILLFLLVTPAWAGWSINGVTNPRSVDGVYYPESVNGVANDYSETQDDVYAETNQDDSGGVWGGGQAQSFTSGGGRLSKVTWYLKKIGSPSGNLYAKVYAHSGTYGTSSVPTGTALATSGAVDVTTLGADFANVDFTFTGANRAILNKDTYYVVTVELAGNDVDNNAQVGQDSSSSSHDGNDAYDHTGSWTAEAENDLCFYVYVMR